MSTDEVRFYSKIRNRMANSVDPDKMAHYKPSHLDLNCLHRYLYRSTVLKKVMGVCRTVRNVFAPSEKRSTLEGKSLFSLRANLVGPLGANSFLLEYTPFQEGRILFHLE